MALERRVSVPSSSAIRMYADPYKLSQVIRNLLSNALKFTASNGSVLVALSLENSSSRSSVGGGGAHTMMDEEAPDMEMGSGSAASSSSKAASSSLSPSLSKLLWLRRSVRREAEVYADSSFLVVSVKDSGAGISKVRRVYPTLITHPLTHT